MLNDGNDPHFALWLTDIPSEDTVPGKPRPVLFVVVLMLILSVGLICAWLAL